MSRTRTILLAILGLVMLAMTAYGSTLLWTWDHGTLFRLTPVQCVVYALAVWVVVAGTRDGRDSRWLLVGILVLAAVMRLVLLPAPTVSTDIFRYVWDGRVQAAGINPYRYIPADPALAPLRDAAIYPSINRADYAPTIYPPVAQMVFFLTTRIAETLTVMKAAMVAFECVIVWCILRLLAARGIARSRVLIYAWHPLPLWEFAGSGHVDAVSIAFLSLAFVAADRRARSLVGTLLAFAALAKFFPLAAGPALWRRWDWRLPLVFLAVAALLYAPYLGVGAKVFGFLGEYLNEEGIQEGSGIYLVMLLNGVVGLPAWVGALYMPAALVLLVLLAAAVAFRRGRPDPDLGGALVLMTAFTVMISPHLAWYFAWLIPLCCVRFHPSVLYLTVAAPLLYLPGFLTEPGKQSLVYGPFLVLLIVELVLRRKSHRTRADGAAVAVS